VAEPLARHRRRGFAFTYGHILIFGSLAAMGAGLHVAAQSLEEEVEIGATATVLSVALPVAVFLLVFYGVYAALFRTSDPFHLLLLAGMAVLLTLSVMLSAAGVGVPRCPLVVALAPVVTVLGYETVGHRHLGEALRQL
jgi:low temperature requirement protein LtrA